MCALRKATENKSEHGTVCQHSERGLQTCASTWCSFPWSWDAGQPGVGFWKAPAKLQQWSEPSMATSLISSVILFPAVSLVGVQGE